MKLGIEQVQALAEEKLKVRACSEKTVCVYKAALHNFGEHLKRVGIADLREVDGATVQGYIRFLEEYTSVRSRRKLAERTKNKWLGCVRRVFVMLVKENLLFLDPFGKVGEVSYKEESLPRGIMTEDEVKRLLKLPELATYFGYRDRTILELLYGTGMRIGELRGLNIYDFDFREELVFIRGKGKKERIIPCVKTALLFVKEYIDKVRPALTFYSGDRALFISKFGRRLSYDGFVKMLQGYLKRSGIRKRITGHSFRHTFATHLLERGVNVRYIQEILGHEKLSSTAIYTHVSIAKLRQTVEAYHPRENELFEADPIELPKLECINRGRRKELDNTPD